MNKILFIFIIQQTSQFDVRKCNEIDDSNESSQNDHAIMNQNENTGNSNTDDINELDNIFGLDSHNGLTSPSKGEDIIIFCVLFTS